MKLHEVKWVKYFFFDYLDLEGNNFANHLNKKYSPVTVISLGHIKPFHVSGEATTDKAYTNKWISVMCPAVIGLKKHST